MHALQASRGSTSRVRESRFLGSGSCWGQPNSSSSCPVIAVLVSLASRPNHTVPSLCLAAGDGCDQFCPVLEGHILKIIIKKTFAFCRAQRIIQ